MADPAKIKTGECFIWLAYNRKLICTQTDEMTGCGPVLSDPITGHDVVRIDRREFPTFDRYFSRQEVK